MYEFQSEKKYIWNCSKIIGLFHFFHWLFYQSITQEHNLPADCALGPFTYVCCENCMSGFFALVLNLSKSGNILFRSMPTRSCLFISASIVKSLYPPPPYSTPFLIYLLQIYYWTQGKNSQLYSILWTVFK